MKTTSVVPQTLHEAICYFADGDNAFNFLKSLRWPDGKVKCPYCQSEDVSFIATRKLWKCKAKHDKQQFSIKIGTVLEDSPIGLDKWLCAFWLIANCKNGISSYELAKDIGITQKSAWFMLHRIRLAMQDGSIEKFSGRVEADETFIGGKARNMHADKKAKVQSLQKGRGYIGKVAVMGLLERNSPERASRVKLRVVRNTRRAGLHRHVKAEVVEGSEVFTDSLRSYSGLEKEYIHNVIDHAECYAKGHVHTNGLENFWSLLKRGIRGTYVSVEPFHLFRYLDEQSFRFNERKDNDAGRFVKVVRGILGKGLRYAKLIGKGQGDGLPKKTVFWWSQTWLLNHLGFETD
jgi:transposase-like protein